MLVKLTGDSINRHLNKQQTIILGGNREPDSLRLLVLDMSRAGSSFRLDPDEPVPELSGGASFEKKRLASIRYTPWSMSPGRPP